MRAAQPYACRRCGTRSYRPVIARDDSGALRPTSTYRCTGCSLLFTSRQAWRDGEGATPTPAPAQSLAHLAPA
ncbi:C2H2-type domain-containing protein [Rubrivivax sp. A210]|uniref:hypothetical protein n=1 Tax=Rubrivivax sp. A210 TaxID=2772301 RepID=UPI001917D3A2|nr:hypothetical protein [Rubrivivax sp. A210]CAD5374886.1 C2H2-type domain-containing protein [Rubrivivax sp. A210]